MEGASEGDGGGIYNTGRLTIRNSTISNNTASNNGGGIHNTPLAKATLINSTVSGNTADDGGGIYGGIVELYNSTVSNNTARQEGGGLYAPTMRPKNSIIAANTALSRGNDCLGAFTSAVYTLLGAADDACKFVAGQGNQIGSPQYIMPLDDYGGSTPTHALRYDTPTFKSIAIDNGDPNGCRDENDQLLTTDQRGLARQYDGNRDGITRCDIGAFELQPSFAYQAYLPLIVR